MLENSMTKGITNYDSYERYFDVDMYYPKSRFSVTRGKEKLAIALLYAARFGFVSPLVLQSIWHTSRDKTIAFLRGLVKEGLLIAVKTQRINYGRIYVLTYAGANHAKSLMRIDFPFRSKSKPIHQVNQNAIMHDAILTYVLSAGMQNCNADGVHKPLWKALVSEIEFKRLYPSNDVKNVDAIVLLNDDAVAAIEIEHSFKRKEQHQTNILKFKQAMLGPEKLYDQVFLIMASNKIYQDTKRFYQQLLKDMQERIDKSTKKPMLTTEEAAFLEEHIVFRTKFIDGIESMFYS